MLGALGGALLGGLISDHSSGALVGGALGGLAGAGGSHLGNRSEGVRMTVNTENGPTIVDTYFNCKLASAKSTSVSAEAPVKFRYSITASTRLSERRLRKPALLPITRLKTALLFKIKLAS